MFSFGKKNERKRPSFRKSIPALIVNKEWHNLFDKKPSQIRSTEKKLEALMKKYSHVKQELKDYENLKKQLMEGILADMDNISEESVEKLDKKMDTNTNLIHDLNSRMDDAEDALLDLPMQIDACNKELIFQTAEVFYPKLLENTEEYQKSLVEIEALKRMLRKKLERKVDLEEENDAIYQKLHQILGAEIIDQLDEYFVGKRSSRKSYDLKGHMPAETDSAFLSENTEASED